MQDLFNSAPEDDSPQTPNKPPASEPPRTQPPETDPNPPLAQVTPPPQASVTPKSPGDLLAELNPQQRAAVEHTDGPAMIIAGAGSGKTRVLTYRLAFLIATGKAQPGQLLALTFTNKAAREMRQRIARLVGPQANRITMGTFHSIFSRILRAEAEHLGYTPDYSIYDADDSRNLVKTLLRELGVDDKKYKPRAIASHMSLAKNELIGPKRYLANRVTDEFTEIVAKVYTRYQQRTRQANALDFDDLLFNMAFLLKKFPAVADKYRNRWRYLMVDEYQDTNNAQYLITKQLTQAHHNLCVVGDDAQSIYSFRGANIQNILSFKKDYPQLQVFKLEQNYRSTNVIVQAANKVIAENTEQIRKTVFTRNEAGEKIKLLRSANEQEEAIRVVDSIREMKMQRGLHNRDIAILYRTNAQSRAMEEALRRAGLPYKIYGGLSFYQRAEIKSVLGYLRLAVNPNDEEALKRVINYPTRGIGDKTLERIFALHREEQVPLWEIVANADGRYTEALGRSAKAVRRFAELIADFARYANRYSAGEAVAYIAGKSGIMKSLHQENTTESLSRWENVQELINAAQEFTETRRDSEATHDLATFLQEVALLTDADQESEADNFVSLMTLHSAKGLEFPMVLLVGLEEDLFPNAMSLSDASKLEEERRLFYVGLTRAEKILVLSYAESRLRFGERKHCIASRFLDDLPEEFLQQPLQRRPHAEGTAFSPDAPLQNPGASRPPRPKAQRPNRLTPVRSARHTARKEPNTSPNELKKLYEGCTVEHSKFGRGTVKTLTEDRIIVDFKQKKNTTLLLKFARLKVVG